MDNILYFKCIFAGGVSVTKIKPKTLPVINYFC